MAVNVTQTFLGMQTVDGWFSHSSAVHDTWWSTGGRNPWNIGICVTHRRLHRKFWLCNTTSVLLAFYCKLEYDIETNIISCLKIIFQFKVIFFFILLTNFLLPYPAGGLTVPPPPDPQLVCSPPSMLFLFAGFFHIWKTTICVLAWLRWQNTFITRCKPLQSNQLTITASICKVKKIPKI